MSGYGDPEKLRAARELAQGFSKAKDPKRKKNAGGGGALGPRKERWEPRQPAQQPHQPAQQPHQPAQQPHQPAQQTRYGQIAAPSWQSPAVSVSSVPPPSRRNYSSISSFSTGRVGKSTVIGSSGLDFINASRTISQDAEKPQESPVSIASQVANTLRQANSNSNGVSTDAHLPSTSPQAPESAPCGNILDAFLSIVAKKPSIGQEIDTLTEILPKAMDLNAPGTVISNVPPVEDHSRSHISQCTWQERKGKGIHETTCALYVAPEKSIQTVNGNAKACDVDDAPKRHSVGVNQNHDPSHLEAPKTSPAATPHASSNGIAHGQDGVNGESEVAVTKTQGLAASKWAQA